MLLKSFFILFGCFGSRDCSNYYFEEKGLVCCFSFFKKSFMKFFKIGFYKGFHYYFFVFEDGSVMLVLFSKDFSFIIEGFMVGSFVIFSHSYYFFNHIDSFFSVFLFKTYYKNDKALYWNSFVLSTKPKFSSFNFENIFFSMSNIYSGKPSFVYYKWVGKEKDYSMWHTSFEIYYKMMGNYKFSLLLGLLEKSFYNKDVSFYPKVCSKHVSEESVLSYSWSSFHESDPLFPFSFDDLYDDPLIFMIMNEEIFFDFDSKFELGEDMSEFKPCFVSFSSSSFDEGLKVGSLFPSKLYMDCVESFIYNYFCFENYSSKYSFVFFSFYITGLEELSFSSDTFSLIFKCVYECGFCEESEILEEYLFFSYDFWLGTPILNKSISILSKVFSLSFASDWKSYLSEYYGKIYSSLFYNLGSVYHKDFSMGLSYYWKFMKNLPSSTILCSCVEWGFLESMGEYPIFSPCTNNLGGGVGSIISPYCSESLVPVNDVMLEKNLDFKLKSILLFNPSLKNVDSYKNEDDLLDLSLEISFSGLKKFLPKPVHSSSTLDFNFVDLFDSSCFDDWFVYLKFSDHSISSQIFSTPNAAFIIILLGFCFQ